MIDLNKYSDKDKAEILHSSGHAQLGHGAQIGAVGNQTFQQRLELAGKARTVAEYRRSIVGARRSVAPRKHSFTRQNSDVRDNHTGHVRTQQSDIGHVKPGFKEPPSRGYDPYA